MPCWPVSRQDGSYQVIDRDGIAYPIRMGGEPVRDLHPGWYPVGLHTGLPPFHLLELRCDAEAAGGIWYLNEDLEFLTHTAQHFNEAMLEEVVAHLSPLLHDIYEQTLCAESAAVAASTRAFDGINPIFVRELIDIVVRRALTPPETVLAARLAEISDRYEAGGVTLSASLVQHSLDLAAEAPAARIASPFDASLLEAEPPFAPGGAVATAQRARDAASGTSVYLLRGAAGQAALYVPVMNTLFATDDSFDGAAVMTQLFTYYATHTDRTPLASVPPEPEPARVAYGKTEAAAREMSPAPAMPALLAVGTEPFDANAEASGGPRARAAADPPGPALPPAPAGWWKRVFGLGHP